MSYELVYSILAENELAEIWNRSKHQDSVTKAAARLDEPDPRALIAGSSIWEPPQRTTGRSRSTEPRTMYSNQSTFNNHCHDGFHCRIVTCPSLRLGRGSFP